MPRHRRDAVATDVDTLATCTRLATARFPCQLATSIFTLTAHCHLSSAIATRTLFCMPCLHHNAAQSCSRTRPHRCCCPSSLAIALCPCHAALASTRTTCTLANPGTTIVALSPNATCTTPANRQIHASAQLHDLATRRTRPVSPVLIYCLAPTAGIQRRCTRINITTSPKPSHPPKPTTRQTQ